MPSSHPGCTYRGSKDQHNINQVHKNADQKSVKTHNIATSNALPSPRTMMVKLVHTQIAIIAVLHSSAPKHLAVFAESDVVYISLRVDFFQFPQRLLLNPRIEGHSP